MFYKLFFDTNDNRDSHIQRNIRPHWIVSSHGRGPTLRIIILIPRTKSRVIKMRIVPWRIPVSRYTRLFVRSRSIVVYPWHSSVTVYYQVELDLKKCFSMRIQLGPSQCGIKWCKSCNKKKNCYQERKNNSSGSNCSLGLVFLLFFFTPFSSGRKRYRADERREKNKSRLI